MHVEYLYIIYICEWRISVNPVTYGFGRFAEYSFMPLLRVCSKLRFYNIDMGTNQAVSIMLLRIPNRLK